MSYRYLATIEFPRQDKLRRLARLSARIFWLPSATSSDINQLSLYDWLCIESWPSHEVHYDGRFSALKSRQNFTSRVLAEARVLHLLPFSHIWKTKMMLLKPVVARQILPIVRSSQVFRIQYVGRPFQAFRRSITAKPTVKAGKNTCNFVHSIQRKFYLTKIVYPERLIVYHAGTGRTVFLGCLKVTTIFIFSFFCLVVAPTHFFAEEEPKWIAAGGMFKINPCLPKSCNSVLMTRDLHLCKPSVILDLTVCSPSFRNNTDGHRSLHSWPICQLHSPTSPSIRPKFSWNADSLF